MSAIPAGSYYCFIQGSDTNKINQFLDYLYALPAVTKKWCCFVPLIPIYKTGATTDFLNLGTSVTSTPYTAIQTDNEGRIPLGVYLAYFTFSANTTISSVPAWSYTFGTSKYGYCAIEFEKSFFVYFCTSGWTGGYGATSSEAIVMNSTPLSDNMIAGHFAFFNIVTANGDGTTTGVKAGFMDSTNINDAFINPSDIRKSMLYQTVNLSLRTIYTTGGSVVANNNTWRQTGGARIITFSANTAPPPPTLATIWTDILNPAKTYSDLWTSYPNEMPSLAAVVYQIRESQALSGYVHALEAKLEALTTATGSQASLLRLGVDNLVTAAGATKGSIDDLVSSTDAQAALVRLGIDNNVTAVNGTKTALDGLSTATGAQASLLRLGLDNGNTALAAIQSSIDMQVDGLTTVTAAQTASLQTSLNEIKTTVAASGGVSGGGFSPDPANIAAVIAMINNGDSIDAILAAYPTEGFIYALEILELTKQTPIEKSSLFSTVYSNLVGGASLRSQLGTYPELLEYMNLAVVDRYLKTGILPS